MLDKKHLTALISACLLGVGASFPAMAADGAKLAEECADCHGKDGNSDHEEVPNIAGFSALYIHDAMMAYQSGDRPGLKFKKEDGTETDMNDIAKELSEDDFNALGEFYAGKSFKSHAAEQKTDPALVAKGEKIFKKGCKKCHADFGTDPDDDAGILGGQWMTYLEHQFKMFHSGEREMPKKMKKKFKKIDEADYPAIINALGSK